MEGGVAEEKYFCCYFNNLRKSRPKTDSTPAGRVRPNLGWASLARRERGIDVPFRALARL